MEAHPLANAFPLLEGSEFDLLVADIEENGLLHPVVRFEGKILDGRNRYNACQRLGIPHREVEFRGDDPVKFVISENLARRHLTPAQLAIAAEALATASQGRPRTKSPDGTEPPKETTIAEATKLTGASGTAVKRVRKVRREAEPEVVAAMDAGQLTPTAAEALTSLPPEEQKAAVAEGKKAAAAKANQVQRAQRSGTAVTRRTDPKVVMTRQMNLPDLRMVQDVAADWDKNGELIVDLDPDKVTDFLKVLRASRAATSKLITLIENRTSPAARAKAAKAVAEAADNGDGEAVATVTDLAAKQAEKKAPAKRTARKAPAKTEGAGDKAPARTRTARKAPAAKAAPEAKTEAVSEAPADAAPETKADATTEGDSSK